MPWMKKDLMSLRGEFVHLVETELLLLATLCQRFGISRKTGYKWLARDRDEGRAGVADRSRRPRRLRPTLPAAGGVARGQPVAGVYAQQSLSGLPRGGAAVSRGRPV